MRFLGALSLILASVSVTALNTRGGDKMTQNEAEDLLKSYGINVASSGNCTDKNHPKCTSLEGILSETVWGVIGLKLDSDCPIIITGGTEVGHPPGKYSHGNGYGVSLRKNACLNKYIGKFPKSGSCRKDLQGNLYCDLGNNWDVTYY